MWKASLRVQVVLDLKNLARLIIDCCEVIWLQCTIPFITFVVSASVSCLLFSARQYQEEATIMQESTQILRGLAVGSD